MPIAELGAAETNLAVVPAGDRIAPRSNAKLMWKLRAQLKGGAPNAG